MTAGQKPSLQLSQKQTQTLAMTPQMRQAISVLQMSAVELQDYLAEEIIKNPLLEQDESDGGPPSAASEDSLREAENALRQLERRRTNDENDAAQDEQRAGTLDADFGNASGDDLPDYDPGAAMAGIGKGGRSNFDNPDFSLENRIAGEKTLRDHLLEQVMLEIPDNKDRMAAVVLIDSLDAHGYLRESAAELAAIAGCGEKRLHKVLEILKNFHPAGVFARDLGECLALQLKEKQRLDAPMQKLLDNLDLLAAHDLKRLMRLCRVDAEKLGGMIAEIKNLNPRPASEFEVFVAQSVIADVVMKKLPKSEGGGWGLEINPDTLPKLLINNRYYTEIKDGLREKQDREYLNARMAEAKFLLRALDQRAQTVLKTAAEIVRRQQGFFDYGVEYLKPMVLRDIAEEIGMHESTVSRVVNGKFIGTPRGVFELRYFFSSRISATGSGSVDHSGEAVKARLKTLIDAEEPEKILSDDKLVALLKKDGVDIARRTVAKYREALGIPSSVQRRRIKRNGL